jgi:DNA-binding MarR family transcriptional regulator
MSTDLGSAEGVETRELVHFVTQQTRFSLVNNILQHPDQLPSMYELEELNPSVSDATVYKHVQKLIDAGIVAEVALDDDQRRQGYPWKFYGLTEEGREFLEEHNLLATEETLQRIYGTISDKPEKMVKYENAPRPDDYPP